MIAFIRIILSFLIASIPAIFWLLIFLFIFRKIHYRTVPLKPLLTFFVMGMLVTFPSFWLEYSYFALFKFLGADLQRNLTLINIVLWCGGLALIEEHSKFFSAYFLFKTDKNFEKAIDAVIYLMILALGFGLMENFGILQKSLTSVSETNFSAQLSSAIGTAIWRFGSANLIHPLCSGIIGFFWALQLIFTKRDYLYVGIFLAILSHSIYNILFMLAGSKSHLFLLVFGSYFAIIVLFELLKKFKPLLQKDIA